MRSQFLFLCFLCCGYALVVSGQSLPSLDQLQAKEKLNAKLREEDAQLKKTAEMKVQRGNESNSAADANLSVVYFTSEKELPAEEKKLLAADASELQKYDAFLRQPDTGLFKLLNYQETKVAITDAKSPFAYPHLRGGGVYYSFAKRHHNADEWAQLRLQDGILQAAYTEMKRTTVINSGGSPQTFAYTSGYGMAMFTALGNVALEAVTLQQAAVQNLVALQLPTQYAEFRQQLKQYSTGLNIGPNWYQSIIPARADMTYVMRSINYKKVDVIVAFRIVQQDADGNLHILWKQLKTFPPAELKGKSAKP